jgi:hypothetical protein
VPTRSSPPRSWPPPRWALLLAPGTGPEEVSVLAEAGNLLAAAVAGLDAVLDPPQPGGRAGPPGRRCW